MSTTREIDPRCGVGPCAEVVVVRMRQVGRVYSGVPCGPRLRTPSHVLIRLLLTPSSFMLHIREVASTMETIARRDLPWASFPVVRLKVERSPLRRRPEFVLIRTLLIYFLVYLSRIPRPLLNERDQNKAACHTTA